MNNPSLLEDKLIAEDQIDLKERPFLTIAIPHYKHSRYLEISLSSIINQTFKGFEILISDDASPDGIDDQILSLLKKAACPFRYYLQPQNLGYDGNVRFCLEAGQGQYVFLLGNDDALSNPNVLQNIVEELEKLEFPDVAFVNFSDWETQTLTKRAQHTVILGEGGDTAIRFFRSFSFVSGLIYSWEAAHQHVTDRWDQSIYYQIYLASRIIASSGKLGAIAVDGVSKDIRIDGQTVQNYITKNADARWSFAAQETGLISVIRVTADAILPLLPVTKRSSSLRRIISQIFLITYPFWLFEYRKVANWSFAVGVARGLFPAKILPEYKHDIRWLDRFILWGYYIVVTIGGLMLPIWLFNMIQYDIVNLIRRYMQRIPLRIEGQIID